MTVEDLLSEFEFFHPHLMRMGLRTMGLGLSEYIAQIEVGSDYDAFIEPLFSMKDGAPMRGAIRVFVPIVFDYTQLPSTWKYFDWGHYNIAHAVDFGSALDDFEPDQIDPAGRIPVEFEDAGDLPWHEGFSAERYIALVDRCGDEIKEFFGRPDMSRSELLDALAFGDFRQHVKQCKEDKERGIGKE
jgi:hypothetical protein